MPEKFQKWSVKQVNWSVALVSSSVSGVEGNPTKSDFLTSGVCHEESIFATARNDCFFANTTRRPNDTDRISQLRPPDI